MRHLPITAILATAMSVITGAANATDVFSQDEEGYELTITSASDTKTVSIAPNGELRSMCSERCIIQLPSGQAVEANETDIVLIIDGVISISE